MRDLPLQFQSNFFQVLIAMVAVTLQTLQISELKSKIKSFAKYLQSILSPIIKCIAESSQIASEHLGVWTTTVAYTSLHVLSSLLREIEV